MADLGRILPSFFYLFVLTVFVDCLLSTALCSGQHYRLQVASLNAVLAVPVWV